MRQRERERVRERGAGTERTLQSQRVKVFIK